MPIGWTLFATAGLGSFVAAALTVGFFTIRSTRTDAARQLRYK